MGKNGPAVGGDVVAAVLVDDCGGLSLGVDAPLVCQPASVEGVSSQQTHGCDQNDDQRVHFVYLFPFFPNGKAARVHLTAALKNHKRRAAGDEKSLHLRSGCRPHPPEDEGLTTGLPTAILRGTTSLAAFEGSHFLPAPGEPHRSGTPCNGGGSARCYCSVRTGCSQGITFLSLLPSYTKTDSSLGAGVGKGRVLFTAFAE